MTIQNVISIQDLFALLLIQILIEKSKAEKQKDKETAAKADDPKAGADVGKIVNLMAGDANRVWIFFLFLGSFNAFF